MQVYREGGRGRQRAVFGKKFAFQYNRWASVWTEYLSVKSFWCIKEYHMHCKNRPVKVTILKGYNQLK